MKMNHEPPEHLDTVAVAKWQEILHTLQQRDDVDQADQSVLDALTCYAAAWGRLVEAESKLKELGAVVKSAAGFAVVNPYASVQKDAQRQLRQWAAVLQLHRPARKADKPDQDGGDILRLLG